MDFLKIYQDMEELFEPFSDEERGRLFTGMMAYAFRGIAPAFSGPERYVWPALRRHIDQCQEKQRIQEENGKKGGRPPKAETQRNPTKPKITQRNPTKPKKTQRNPTKPQKNKNKNRSMNRNKSRSRRRTRARPRPQRTAGA